MKKCTHPGCKVCGRIKILPPGTVADPRKLGREDAALDFEMDRLLAESGEDGETSVKLDEAVDRLVSAGLLGATQRDEYKRGYRAYLQERRQ